MKDFIRILLSVILLPAYLIADDPDNQNAPAPEDTKPEIKEEQNEEEQKGCEKTEKVRANVAYARSKQRDRMSNQHARCMA